MEKTIYIVYDEPKKGDGDIFENCPTFDRDKAVKAARYAWDHLTTREQEKRNVYVGIHTVTLPDDDHRSAEQIYRDLMGEDEWPYDHDVIEIQEEKPIEIQFESGEGIHFRGGVNMLVNRSGIYAECPITDDASDDYGYLTLKKAILAKMEELNLKTDNLVFWYDGQEQFLDPDASADCEVYVDINC